jgi:hypothetical protein
VGRKLDKFHVLAVEVSAPGIQILRAKGVVHVGLIPDGPERHLPFISGCHVEREVVEIVFERVHVVTQNCTAGRTEARACLSTRPPGVHQETQSDLFAGGVERVH